MLRIYIDKIFENGLKMNENEQREYSLVRAVRAAQTGNWKDAANS